MAQWAKVQATKPENPNLILVSHVVEGRTDSLVLCGRHPLTLSMAYKDCRNCLSCLVSVLLLQRQQAPPHSSLPLDQLSDY